MPKPFSTGAGKLSAFAAHILGWSPDQFWRSTPAELEKIFNALAKETADDRAPLGAEQMIKLKEIFPDG